MDRDRRTSPFGAYGYNPEGVRIGQDGGRNRQAIKVWDKREFRNLDNSVELGTRNIKVAMRRLRRFAREGSVEELDLDGTIDGTARKGWLDIQMRAERHNVVKLLLFLDVGGSMDPHIKLCEELFSAATSEFKNLEFFYFHNCPYESLWKDNHRRFNERSQTWDVLHKFGHDYKLVFVGDASMSPYEITHAGGSVEHHNEEAGAVWLDRLTTTYPASVWLNPVPERYWGHTGSIQIVRQLMQDRMYPLTLEGLDSAMRTLSRKSESCRATAWLASHGRIAPSKRFWRVGFCRGPGSSPKSDQRGAWRRRPAALGDPITGTRPLSADRWHSTRKPISTRSARSWPWPDRHGPEHAGSARQLCGAPVRNPGAPLPAPNHHPWSDAFGNDAAPAPDACDPQFAFTRFMNRSFRFPLPASEAAATDAGSGRASAASFFVVSIPKPGISTR